MFGLRKVFACAALTAAGGEQAAAHSFRETVNRILLGSAQDRSGLVEIQDASDCTVKLSNPKNASYAVLRFNNVDPRSFEVRGKPGESFMTFGGPDIVLEVHDSDAEITAASERIQISASDPAEERRSFHQLYARFCSGKRSTSVGVGS